MANYTVKSGDTGYAIAKNNGMPFKTLQKLNPTVDWNKMPIGQSLVLSLPKTPTQSQTSSSYTVKSGDTGYAIANKLGISLDTLRKANPNVDLNRIKPKQILRTSIPTQTSKTSSSSPSLFATSTTRKTAMPTFSRTTTPKTSSTSGIMTLEKFEANLSAEAKALIPHIKSEEGKVKGTYIAPEGMATIGHGHLLINKPKFLLNIEKQNLSASAKNKKVKEALKNPANAALMKASLQKDLQDAIKTTGIKNVASTVSSDLQLTDAQIKLLLNSDIKKAQNAMEKQFGKEILKKRTTNQKLVALDLCYNVGGNLKKKAPNFVKEFKAGNIGKAQAELDIFKSDGKIYLGLMRRNYERMQLLNDNKGISDAAKTKLLNAYNQYCREHSKQVASNFTQAEKILKT